jgi:hypothetical protein
MGPVTQGGAFSQVRSCIIRRTVTPDHDAQSPPERDFERWRVATEITQQLREAGIKCELNIADQTHN